MKKLALAVLLASAAITPALAAPPSHTPAATINGSCRGPLWNPVFANWGIWTPCFTGGLSWY